MSGSPLASSNMSTSVKATLRTAALARRDALSPAVRDAAAAAIAARALPVEVGAGAVVSGFIAIRSEIDPMPLMRALAARGARLALPVVAGRGKPLLMREWRPGAPLVAAPFGLREPAADAPDVDPDILLVPLSCFDRSGHRIGYGAGHYDRTLQGLGARKKIVAIGIAFALQEIERVPATDHDERLDFVITERETIDCRTM